MATPHVAGVAALVRAADPTYLASQVNDVVVANATAGVLTSIGTGSPNRLLLSRLGSAPPPPPPPALVAVHVADNVTTRKTLKSGVQGTAVITMHDASGGPASGLTVSGSWKVNGAVVKSASALTGSTGTCTITSGSLKRVRATDAVEFCVTGATGTGFTYDAGANVVTCDTAP